MSTIISQIIRRQLAATIPKFSGYAAFAGAQTGGHKLWKQLAFIVGFPCMGLCMLNSWLKQQEDHRKPRPEFKKYDYLCRREKRFPWGDGTKTFFHNPHVNALPDGYET